MVRVVTPAPTRSCQTMEFLHDELSPTSDAKRQTPDACLSSEESVPGFPHVEICEGSAWQLASLRQSRRNKIRVDYILQ